MTSIASDTEFPMIETTVDTTRPPVDHTSVKVIADSYWDPIAWKGEAPYRKRKSFARITTFEITLPRCVLAEFNTHCQLARNSASSRAIPVEKMIERLQKKPFVPQQFSKKGPGMSASGYWVPGDDEYEQAVNTWFYAMEMAIRQAKQLDEIGVHKQDVNRLLEPFMYHTIIATATWEKWDWPNFIRLRTDTDNADPKISTAAIMLRDVAAASEPVVRSSDDRWHLPLIGFDGDEELSSEQKIKVSAARCARVSYLTHDGIRDIDADLALFKRLKENGHYSPFEHPAHPAEGRHAKYTDWRSARTYIEQGQDPR